MSFYPTPKFWYRPLHAPAPLVERLLSPLAFVYTVLYTLHQKSKTPYISDVPVICLGNLVAGGTGKTPTALAVLDLIRRHKLAQRPFFLSRGYGGAEAGPLLVNPAVHTAWDVGDEPLILARSAPVIVAHNRAEGAKFAKTQNADLIVMDDGLQNPGLKKNLKLLVINGEMGFGNLKLLPAGPLRQPLRQGLAKVEGYILIGEDRKDITKLLPHIKPLIHARIVPDETDPRPDPALKYVAFAGLGYPDKFFNFLRQDLGLTLLESLRFSDHHPYTADDLSHLHHKARQLGATLITTEKDLMRLPDRPEYKDVPIKTVKIKTVFDTEEQLVNLLRTVLKQTQ